MERVERVSGEAAAVLMLREAVAMPRSAIARVEVHREAAPVVEAWAELEVAAPCSVYQTRAWLLPWIATLAPAKHTAPLFVLARGADAQPVALLCLGLVKRGPLRVAKWLGGTDANFNMPLVRPDVVLQRHDIRRLLREAAQACGAETPCLFNLVNQPHQWAGRANPFAALPHQVSPSPAFGTMLPADAEALFAIKLSKDTRKKLRKKEAKLTERGALRHVLVADAETRRRVIERFLAQKLDRFRSRDIVSDFESPEMGAFIEAASAPDGHGIELHALVLDDRIEGERIVAIYGGAAHAGQWSGMFNSFDTDPEIAKTSPGDLLLARIVAACCRDGLTRFDLGIGEARYKAALCDERIELFDAIVPVTALGRIFALLLAVRQQIKRRVKSDPRLLAVAKKVRALLRA